MTLGANKFAIQYLLSRSSLCAHVPNTGHPGHTRSPRVLLRWVDKVRGGLTIRRQRKCVKLFVCMCFCIACSGGRKKEKKHAVTGFLGELSAAAETLRALSNAKIWTKTIVMSHTIK